MDGGGFSARATGRFVSDMMGELRRRPLTLDKLSEMNNMTPVSNGATNSEDTTVCANPHICTANVRKVEKSAQIMTAVRRILSDIVSGGVTLEITTLAGETLHDRLDSDRQRQTSDQLRLAAESMYIHWIANGFAVLQVVQLSDDLDVRVIRVLDPSEYVLTWTRKQGQTRKYSALTWPARQSIAKAYIAIDRAPDDFGATRGMLSSIQELLDVGACLVRNHAQADYWRAHPVPVTEPSAAAGRMDRNEVMGAPHFSVDDNQEMVEEARVRVITMHSQENNDAVGEAIDTNETIAAETMMRLSSQTGAVDAYHPALEALRNPPYRNIFRVGLDRHMSAAFPVPQLNTQLVAVQNYINSLVYAIIGAPPEMRGDVVEKTATETSILWRYYTNQVRELQDSLSNHLSIIWRGIAKREFKRMFLDDFEKKSPPEDDEVREAARTLTRDSGVELRLASMSVRVRFNHVPTIQPEAIAQLQASDIISEETAAQYMAAYHGVPAQDVLTPEQRQKQRKRRLDDEVSQTQRLAIANAAGKPVPGKPTGP